MSDLDDSTVEGEGEIDPEDGGGVSDAPEPIDMFGDEPDGESD